MRQAWFALLLLILAACTPQARAPRGSVGSLNEAVVVAVAETATPAAAEEEDPHAQSPIPVTREDPVLGHREALVTIVAFLDLQCPFCARVQATLDRIRSEYPADQVRLVWKHNPLAFHKEARPAQEAAIAVFRLAGNDAFFRFTRHAFDGQRELTTDNLARWAQEEGVTRADLGAALAEPEVSDKLERDMALAQRIGATGTPGFRINGVTLAGAQPFERFAAIIDDQLRAAQELLSSDVPRREVSLRLTQQNYAQPAPKALVDETPADTTVHQILVNADDPVRGPKDALVTIVEWGDFQCPFCKRVADTLERIRQDYPDDVRIVWKDNPLPFHKEALPAARFAHYVRTHQGNDAFWAVHDALFAGQADLGEELYERLAKKRGLPWSAAKLAIEDESRHRHIRDDQAQASDFDAKGTPHFFINGLRLSGAQPRERFEELIVQQIAVARRVMEDGVLRKDVYDELMKSAVPAPAPGGKEH